MNEVEKADGAPQRRRWRRFRDEFIAIVTFSAQSTHHYLYWFIVE